MYLWKFDQQYRLDSPPPSTPLYYWTNTYYFLQALEHEPDYDNCNFWYVNMRTFIPRRTTQIEWRATSPAGDVVWPLGTIENSGIANFYGDPGPIPLCVYVDFFHQGRRVGYKKYRGPWQDSLVNGSLWDSALISWFNDSAMPELMFGNPCNHRGVLFDDYRVRPDIHLWQQRHGSKRATRPVFVYPAGG